MHQVIKRGSAYAEQFGGLAQVAVDASQDAQHGVFFRLVANLPQIERTVLRGCRREPDITGADRRTIRHDNRTLDDIFKFTHVAGPGMGLDRGGGVGQKRHRPAFLLGRDGTHETVCEQRRVTLPRAQRRNLDEDLGEPIVKVFAKLLVCDLVREAPVRGADNAHVDGNFLAATNAFDDALLQKTQQLGLQRQR